MPTTLKSVRLPDQLIADVTRLQGTTSFNQVVRASLKLWVKRRKRRIEDDMIVRSLASRSPEQIAEEQQLARLASEAASRVLAEADQ